MTLLIRKRFGNNMAAGKASLLSFLCGLVSFIFLYFTPVSCGPVLQPVDLPKKFGEAKEFWQENKCVFPTVNDYEADALASLGHKSTSFPLKACSAVDPTSENLNFTLVLCSTFFEVSRAFCKTSLESKQYLVQTSQLVDDPEWQVCDAAVELEHFNVNVFSFMTKDTSVCEHQCVDNRNLSPVCRLLIAAAVRYEEDYNMKELQGTSIRGHEEKAQDVEKKTQLDRVPDDEENISEGQHSTLTLPPVAPSQEPSSMASPQGSGAAEPAKENSTAVPVKGNGATKQQEENNEAPSEESSTLAPQKSATVAPSNENSSTAPPHGSNTAVPAKENITAEPPTPNSAMAPPKVIVTAVSSSESSSGALPQENNSTSPQEIDIAGPPQANSTATSPEESPATMSPQRNSTAELSEGEGKPTPPAGAVESLSAETERFQTVSSSSTEIYDSVAGQGETGRNETGQNETGQDKTTSVEIQSPLPSGSSAVEQESDFTIDTEYEKETTSSGSFMAYFITAVVLCVAGYVVYHNRQKILAFIMEGRQEQHRRRSATGGGSTAKYSKLHSSAEEAMPSLDKSVTSKNYIY